MAVGRLGTGSSGSISRRTLLLGAYLAAVILYFSWEALTYRGLFALLAEWQFHELSRHFPIFTLGVLVLPFFVPALLIAFVRSRRLTRTGLPAHVAGEGLLRAIGAFAIAFALVAVVSLVWALFVPDVQGRAPTVAIANATPGTVPTGRAVLDGHVDYRDTVILNQHLLFWRRGIRFAPLIEPGRDLASGQFFIEVPPRDARAPLRAVEEELHLGLLRRNALPGSVDRVFRYAGLPVADPYFVLYVSRDSLRWPCYILAAYAVSGAGLLGLLALVQRRRVRRRRAARAREEIAMAAGAQ